MSSGNPGLLPPIGLANTVSTPSRLKRRKSSRRGTAFKLPKSKSDLAEGMDFSRGEGKLYFEGEREQSMVMDRPRSRSPTPTSSRRELSTGTGIDGRRPSFSFNIPKEDTAAGKSAGDLQSDLDPLIQKAETKKQALIDSAAVSFSHALRNKQGRFKSLARMVKANILWTKEPDNKDELVKDNQSFVVTNTEDGRTETLSFNPVHYKVHGKTYGGMTAKTKMILMKSQDQRTEEEIENLKRIIDRLKCFDKYSTKVKHEMARVLEYDTFEDGKVIIKQGHIGISFYFIVSGAVRVLIRETDKTTGLSMSHCIGELQEGSTFGELALLHNIKRTATIVCKGTSEFLRIDKEDFDMVFRRSYEYEYTQRLNGLKCIDAFKNLRADDIAAMNNNCKTVEFPAERVILGNTKEVPESVFFVNSGSAQVIREIMLTREDLGQGEYRYHLPSVRENGMRDMMQRRRALKYSRPTVFNAVEERHLLSLCTLRKGDYFGVGEDLTDTFVISAERVEITLVPRVLFVKYGQPKLLERMRIDWEAVLPDNKSTFNRYIKDKKWKTYRRDVVAEVVSRRKRINSTTIADVPFSLRQNASCQY